MSAMAWTRDAQGNKVRWNRPPYYVRGVVNLVLPGEQLVNMATLSQRRAEFMKLQREDLQRKKIDGPGS